jgi:hypothetical protein
LNFRCLPSPPPTRYFRTNVRVEPDARTPKPFSSGSQRYASPAVDMERIAVSVIRPVAMLVPKQSVWLGTGSEPEPRHERSGILIIFASHVCYRCGNQDKSGSRQAEWGCGARLLIRMSRVRAPARSPRRARWLSSSAAVSPGQPWSRIEPRQAHRLALNEANRRHGVSRLRGSARLCPAGLRRGRAVPRRVARERHMDGDVDTSKAPPGDGGASMPEKPSRGVVNWTSSEPAALSGPVGGRERCGLAPCRDLRVSHHM